MFFYEGIQQFYDKITLLFFRQKSDVNGFIAFSCWLQIKNYGSILFHCLYIGLDFLTFKVVLFIIWTDYESKTSFLVVEFNDSMIFFKA